MNREITTLSGHQLRGRVFSAPMAGYTDPPYRILMKEFGIPVLFTEMIDSHALIHRNEKTLKMIGDPDPEVFTQIAAGTPVLADHAMAALHDIPSAGINLNMGCPAKKVVSCGGGSNLLRYPQVIQDICKVVRKRAGNSLFSVKFRSGWNDCSLNYEEIGKIYEGEGVDFVMLHARTRAQSFSGRANWAHIKQLKELLKIPVIGNGDIVSYESAKQMADETGCDGVAIGRGAVGNPWVYRQAERAVLGLPPLEEPSPQERLRVIVRHYELICAYYGNHLGPHVIRKHLVGYLKGLPGHKAIKEKLFLSETLSVSQLHEILAEYFNSLNDLQMAKKESTGQICADDETEQAPQLARRANR
jgi:tRNA-dihydrouridine synthase B